MTHLFFAKSTACLSMVLGLLLVSTSALAQTPAPQLTPAQMAFIKAETRKAEEGFVKDVAQIVAVRNSVVTKAMPAPGRIADPIVRLIAGLEGSLGKALSDDQKIAIQAADLERQKHVDWATLTAPKR